MTPTCRPHVAELITVIADASNFEGSAFWNPDPSYGVGGWGDPNDDYQVPNGGFATDFPHLYPSPHRLRRNYTETLLGQPLLYQIMPENVAALVNGSVGTFIGFQAGLENGPHTAIHVLVGGCVDLLTALSFRPLTGPTQGSRGAVPCKRPC
jgi:tyrosinase